MFPKVGETENPYLYEMVLCCQGKYGEAFASKENHVQMVKNQGNNYICVYTCHVANENFVYSRFMMINVVR